MAMSDNKKRDNALKKHIKIRRTLIQVLKCSNKIWLKILSKAYHFIELFT